MMMNLYKTIALVIVTTTTLSLSAQKADIEKGKEYFEEYSYAKAIEKYEPIEPKTNDINRILAKSYARIGNVELSEIYYEEVVNSREETPTDIYEYAAILSMNGKYKEAEKWMKKYSLIVPQDSRGKQYKSLPGFYRDLEIDKGKYAIHNLATNSDQEDFGISYYKDKIVFTSSRGKSSKAWNRNGLSYLDIYVASADEQNELFNIEPFHKKINDKYHEGPATFNEDGDYMIFTSNSYEKRNSKGILVLQLFSSKFIDGEWTDERALPFNNTEYSVGHASLTPDGKTVYFSSNMPGGKGGVDLYKSILTEDGSWGIPENLGDKINTEGDEMFPFIHSNGKMLFFASNGHLGLGGLDIFIAEVKDNSYGEAKNLGVPINSLKDDFSFVLDKELKTGYFTSSNREDGKGNDDIYSFKLLKPFSFVK